MVPRFVICLLLQRLLSLESSKDALSRQVRERSSVLAAMKDRIGCDLTVGGEIF
jgi:hypothetical protein